MSLTALVHLCRYWSASADKIGIRGIWSALEHSWDYSNDTIAIESKLIQTIPAHPTPLNVEGLLRALRCALSSWLPVEIMSNDG